MVFLGAAVLLLLAFVIAEARSEHPLLPLRVVTERNRAGAYLASLLTGAGLFAMFVFLSYYLQGVLHYSALKAGIAFLPFAAGIILAAMASSVIVPKIGPRVPMVAGLLVGAVGLAWLSRIGVDTPYWSHVLPQELLMSVGLGLAFPAFASTALINVHNEDSGVASALVNTSQQVGGSLGTALLNTIAATATANYLIAHGPSSALAGTVHGFALAFLAGAGMLVLGAAAERGLRHRPIQGPPGRGRWPGAGAGMTALFPGGGDQQPEKGWPPRFPPPNPEGWSTRPGGARPPCPEHKGGGTPLTDTTANACEHGNRNRSCMQPWLPPAA